MSRSTRPSIRNCAVMGHEVVDRRLPHLLHHLERVLVAERLDRLQIVQRRAVDAGLHHGRHVADLLDEALREGAGLVILVPVEGRGELQPLGCLQARAHGRR